jgi:hypothetical protein
MWSIAQNWVAKNPNHFYVGFAATGKQDARILLSSELDLQKCDACYEIVLGAFARVIRASWW